FTGRSGWGDWTSRLEIGVAVFFLISGFLLYRPFVGAALPGKPQVDTKRFLRRRLLRILPAYFVALTVIGYVFGDIPTQGVTGAERASLARRWVPWLCSALAFVAFWAVSTQVPLSRKPLYHTGVGPALARQALYGAFGFLLLIPAVFGPQNETLVRKFLRWRPIAYFGLISYGVYIWHELWITE